MGRLAPLNRGTMATVLDAVTEAAFQKQIEDALSLFGWRWQHVRPAVDLGRGKGWRTTISGSKGFPDIIAARAETILYVELKSERGKLSEDQREWLVALLRGGGSVYVWRPSWLERAIEVLR